MLSQTLAAGDYTVAVGAFNTDFSAGLGGIVGGAGTGDYALSVSLAAVAVPEPGSLAIIAVVGLVGLARRRR